MSETITLRPATMGDARRLLAWRNDAKTRRAAHTTKEVQPDEHVGWLAEILGNPNRRLFIVEESGLAVGTVRADLSDGVWELSWTVGESARGRGVGKRMVALLVKQISAPVRAEVKRGNAASVRIAEYAGMRLEREADGVLHYMRAVVK